MSLIFLHFFEFSLPDNVYEENLKKVELMKKT